MSRQNPAELLSSDEMLFIKRLAMIKPYVFGKKLSPSEYVFKLGAIGVNTSSVEKNVLKNMYKKGILDYTTTTTLSGRITRKGWAIHWDRVTQLDKLLSSINYMGGTKSEKKWLRIAAYLQSLPLQQAPQTDIKKNLGIGLYSEFFRLTLSEDWIIGSYYTSEHKDNKGKTVINRNRYLYCLEEKGVRYLKVWEKIEELLLKWQQPEPAQMAALKNAVRNSQPDAQETIQKAFIQKSE